MTYKKEKSMSFGAKRRSLLTHSILLVHPFKKATSYGNILQIWTRKSVDDERLLQACVSQEVFSFDASDVLSGRTKELEAGFKQVAARLRRKIQHLHSAAAPQSVIFIAHSLAVWVVKEALASWESGNVAFVPAGMVFVDVNNLDFSSSHSYTDYLESFRDKFSMKLSKDQLVSSANFLRVADENFKKFERSPFIQREISQGRGTQELGNGIRSQSLSIWLSDMPLLPANKSGKRLPYLDHLKIIKRREPEIDKLSVLELGKTLISMITRDSGGGHDAASPMETRGNIEPGNNSHVAPFTFAIGGQFLSHLATTSHSATAELRTQDAVSPPSDQVKVSINLEESTDSLRTPRSTLSEDNPRLPYLPSDQPAYRPSMESLLHLPREGRTADSDKLSLFSIPALFIGDRDDEELKNTVHFARSFFLSGELENAELLFSKSISLLNTMSPTSNQGAEMQIRMQIAAIKLYRGKYDDANLELSNLRTQFGSLEEENNWKKTDAEYELERLISTSLLLQGRYSEAAEGLEKLLDQRNLSHDSQMDTKEYDIQVQKDLALAYGYLGYYGPALKNIEEAKKKAVKAHAKGHSVYFASAKLDMLWGEYRAALVKSQKVLRILRKLLGRTHLETLESASLEAVLLAFMSEYSKAEMSCKELLPIMIQVLGRNHPLTLETMGCLVYIFRAQSRFTEAIDTARSLCKITSSTLTAHHPQTLRARSQFAASQWSLGQYHSAEQEIQEVVGLCEKHTGQLSPSSLRYQAELARVLCSCGKVDKAKELALNVIAKQRRLYSLSRGKETPPTKLGCAFVVIEANSNGVLDEIINEVEKDKMSFELHSCLIFTLQVLASIEMNNPQAELELPRRLLEIVLSRRKEKLGPSHTLTLETEYELASVLREKDADGSGDRLVSAQLYYHVWEERVRLFGERHADTMSAERELVITICGLGVWQDGGPAKRERKTDPRLQPDGNSPAHPLQQLSEINGTPIPAKLSSEQWADVERVSHDIFQRHEHQLGPRHPETLKSIIWLFSVRLLRRVSVLSMLLEVLERLRHPTIRKERLVEALQMERQLALILAEQGRITEEQGHIERAVKISRDLVQEIETPSITTDHTLKPILESLRMDLLRDIDDLKTAVPKNS